MFLKLEKREIKFYKKKGFVEGDKKENPDSDYPMILEFSKISKKP